MEYTRNQKRMYRIKKLEERIVDLENISKKAISELTIANDKLKKIEEYINTITEEITMLKQDGYDMYDIKDLKWDIKLLKKLIKGEEE